MNTPNDTYWFYSDRQQSFGPVSAGELVDLILQGQVSRKFLVMPQGGTSWMPIHASPFEEYLPQGVVMVHVPQAAAVLPHTAAAIRPAGGKKAAKPARWPLLLLLSAVMAGAVYLVFVRRAEPPQRRTLVRIEGEKFKVARTTGPAVEVQSMTDFSSATWSDHSQLLWIRAKKEDTLTLVLPVREAGWQRLMASLTLAPNFSRIEITLDGKPVPGVPIQLQHPSVTRTGLLDWGVHDLAAGNHELAFHFAADTVPDPGFGCGLGLDFVQLEPPVLPVASSTPGTNLAPSAVAGTSHCWGGDTVTALNDNVAPASGRSLDRTVLRHTFWDHRGSLEWAQYDWDAPQCVNQCDVFWWADGGGAVLPQSWSVLYRDASGAWVPVQAEPSSPKADQWDTLQFPAVITRSLRLSVQCAADKSVGLMEWKALAADPAGVSPAAAMQPVPEQAQLDAAPSAPLTSPEDPALKEHTANVADYANTLKQVMAGGAMLSAQRSLVDAELGYLYQLGASPFVTQPANTKILTEGIQTARKAFEEAYTTRKGRPPPASFAPEQNA